jgi:hypothetical protein
MKSPSNILRKLAIVASTVGAVAGGDRASGDTIKFGSNYYAFVSAVGISWADANTAASASVFLGVNGHLATITSAAENDSLANSVADFSAFDGLLAIAWLGAQVTSAGIGTWVVGPEAGQQFSQGQTPLNGMYTNWGGIEPNNAPSALEMQVGTLNWFGITHGKWADARNGLSSPCPGICDPIVGYFVEYESPNAVPLNPSIVSQITGLAMLGGLLAWRRKRKRAFMDRLPERHIDAAGRTCRDQ